MTRVRVRIHPTLFLLPGLLFLLCPEWDIRRFFLFLLSALTHEGGHLFFLILFHIPLKELVLTPVGIRLRADFSRCGYGREAIVHGAGSFANFLLSLLFFYLGNIDAAMLSLLLGLYNLLPFSCFDGGRLLHALLLALTPIGEPFADTFCRFFSAGMTAALYCFSGGLLWYGALYDPLGVTFSYGALFLAVFGVILLRCRD